ncbi:serine hydrolase [uncultured Cohaesibacter sp.]|uniref:serine hydrolase n=1 Tax=uncultured Cohaesibacter sp. TaxID=1002546 RepID=UPI00292ED05A|nr:serine hydrolase [uncultured Cohaesibacter sp.]
MYRVAFRANWHVLAARSVTMIAATILLAIGIVATATPTRAANNKYAAYVIDVKSGKVLFSRYANSHRYPASLTKMMTLYMVFEQLEQGKLSLGSRLTVSKHAAGQAPSKLGLKPGSTISVKDAILALVTKSANDVAATVAENIGGTESKFASMMTAKARSLGMKNTTFKNASGLPNQHQKTTAADMALLGQALQDRFPTYFDYFDTRSFRYGNARYGNHNKLLGRVKGVNGIKTGYTRASGFNLVTNVETRDRHIVAVVMGGKSGTSRDAHMKSLIAKYLPKAKTGRRMTALIGVPQKSYIKLAETIRLPRAKTGASDQPLVMASSTAMIPETAAETPTNDLTLGVLPRAPVELASVSATPRPRLTTAALAVPPLPRAANDPIGDLSTHSPALPEVAPKRQVKPQGWHIQLGATPSLQKANALLDKARNKNASLLLNQVNYTETVQKGDATLYRARFAGFTSKSAARDACAILKKQKFACLALKP